MNPELPPPTGGIPGPEDFLGGHDCDTAREHFCGKSLEEAERMFLESPYYYQEDFMWMGEGSFRFYYPIVDRYLRSITSAGLDESSCAGILASDIGTHFDCGHTLKDIPPLVIDLCDHILSHLDNYVWRDSEGFPTDEERLKDRAELEQSYRALREKAVRHVDGVRPAES